MHFSIITLFPEMFTGIFSHSIIARAQKNKAIQISFINLRDFGIGTRKQIDDKPYGGGTGMLIRVDVMHKAIKHVKRQDPKAYIILLDPKGKRFVQEDVETLIKHPHIVLICGHYEGYDARIEAYVDSQLSLGDFVLTGGEIPAMAIVDAITRHIPGVLLKEDAPKKESFSIVLGKRLLEHPQYTRPQEYLGKKVPKELLTGDPKITERYRILNSKTIKK